MSTPVVTGAATPGEITHGFSLTGGHLAWAICAGKKRIENRKGRMQPGWYAFGCSLTAHTGVMEDNWYREIYSDSDYPGFSAFYNMPGKLVGVCHISHSLPHSACKHDDHAAENYPIKNIIDKVIPLVSVIPAKGNFGSWPLSYDAKVALHSQLGQLLAGGDDVILNTNGEKDFPPDPTWNGKAEAPEEGSSGQAKGAPKGKAKVPSKPAAKTQASTAPKPKKATVTAPHKPNKTIEKDSHGKIPVAPTARPPKRGSEESDEDDVPAARGTTGDIRSFFGKR